jgi:hypothetical protein
MDLFKAWISTVANYEQFKRLIADHTDFPDTYDEWLGLANEQVTHMIKQGYFVTKVTIDPAEFTQYCDRTGSDHDPFSLDDLANFKGSTRNRSARGKWP